MPVFNQEQREALDFARSVAGSGSLIPADKRYHQQQNRHELSAEQKILDKQARLTISRELGRERL